MKEPNKEDIKAIKAQRQKIQNRVSNLNIELSRIKTFVFIFCVISIGLNTYHIRKLKEFSESLADLMNIHAGTLKQLNIMRQIKDIKDESSGGGNSPETDLKIENRNLTLRTFFTEKNKKQPQVLFSGMDSKKVVKKREEFKNRMKNEMTFDIDLNILSMEEYYIPQNFIISSDYQSKFFFKKKIFNDF